MKKNILIGILVVVICLGGFVLWNQKYHDYYSPYDEEKFLDIEGIEYPEFSYLLETYLKLQKSGLMVLVNREEGEDIYEDLGHNSYRMKATITDVSKQKDFYIRPANMELTIEKSILKFEELEEEYVLTNAFDEFVIPENNYNYRLQESETYQNIKSVDGDIDVSISFQDYQSLEDITTLMQSCQNTEFIWLAMDSVDQGNIHPIGLSLLEESYGQKLTTKTNKRCPHLSLQKEDIYDAKALQQSYLSRLILLKNHASFLELMSNAVMPHYIQEDVIDELCKQAAKQPQCYGIRLKTDSQNLMSLINQWNVSHLYIHE